MKKKCIIWGTGTIAKRTYYKQRNNYDIQFLSQEQEGLKELYGVSVISELPLLKDSYIVISDANWEQICQNLEQRNYHMIDDYIPYWALEHNIIGWRELFCLDGKYVEALIQFFKKKKKIAIIFGNCQTELIQRFLVEEPDFCERYYVLSIPRVCQETEDVWSMLIDSVVYKMCDLFIYQRVSNDNRFGLNRATDIIIQALNATCKKVCIPNIYFDGYFPQIEKNPYNVLQDVQEDGMFKWGDKFCREQIEKGLGSEDIIKIISDDNFFETKDIETKIRTSFENLMVREKNVDIKMSDYIIDNYAVRQLFFAPNHPNNEVLIECTRRILQYLKLNVKGKYESTDEFNSLMGEDIPIYPSVVKILGLKQHVKSFYPNRYIERLSLSFEEYYRMYIGVTKGEINQNC